MRRSLAVHVVLVTVLTLATALHGADPEPHPSFDAFGGLDPDPAIPTPRSILGYRIGDHFTRDADMVTYLRRLADASDRVLMERYGRTNERRDLHILTISAPENLDRLDEILERNRALADPATDDATAARIIESNPAIVWFSYNVHGNEPSPSECAMQLAYTLAASRSPEAIALLDEVVVVIDPCLNPDGRERYVSWYQSTRGTSPIADPDAAEHDEPWPGGRTNHYYFDLNRDWIWLTQVESRQRLPVYRRYLPQLHVDHHEQGYREPFFFGAGDDPYHEAIPEETRRWIERYGDANARAFDREGLLYSTAERFDYLYPGYGKVLPVYYGAVGMLAEQAGHGQAGLAITVTDTYTLTLAERTHHHFVLGLSNLKATAELRREQLERFRRFFDPKPFAREHEVTAFLFDARNNPGGLQRLWDLCASHGIEIETLDEPTTMSNARDYRDGRRADPVTLPAGSWVVRVEQPMGRLAATMLERHTTVVDPDTYDITAWSVPVTFGLRAWYLDARLDVPTSRLDQWAPPAPEITGTGRIAVIVDSAQTRFARAIASVARNELTSRLAGDAFVVDEQRFEAGSLVVHESRNTAAAIRRFLEDLERAGLDAHRASTGMTSEGPVLAANSNRPFTAPRPILLRGEPVSGNSYGQLWHLLDVECDLPHVPVNVDALRRVDLDEHTMIIVPEIRGNLSTALGDGTHERLERWLRDGGTLVALGSGADWASRELLGLPRTNGNGDGNGDGDGDELPASELTYEQRQERGVEGRVPGATLGVTIDQSHPLSHGAPQWLGVLKRGTRVLPVGDGGHVVARYDDEPVIGGHISDENAARLAGTPMMTHHRMGRGQVICFADDVTFRGFQYGPMRLLINAIVMSGRD